MFQGIEYTDSYYDSLSRSDSVLELKKAHKKIGDLYKEIAILLESKKIKRAVDFSASSEQMLLFPEEESKEPVHEEVTTITVKEHKREIKKKHKIELPSDAPVLRIDHTAEAPEQIIKDGVTFNRAEDFVVQKIARIPAHYIVEENVYAKYVTGNEDAQEKWFVKYDNDTLDKLSCSADFLASVAVNKYDDHLPLYRQSQIFERDGLNIGRQTMAKWLIKGYGELLNVEKHFEKVMYKMNYLNMDETPLEVLENKDKNGKISKSSYVFIRSGISFNETTRKTQKLICCSYIQSRMQEVLTESYKKYNSEAYVMTDGLSGYKAYEKHCSCWVHAIRGFKQILKATNEKNATEVVKKYQKLYLIEKEYRDKLNSGQIDVEEFLKQRKDKCQKVINEIFSFLKEIQDKYAPKGSMGKAISYILERTDTLPKYLDVVEGTPDNNTAERIAKDLAVSRKNWLFSSTVDGADTSCFLYSLIESAKANNIKSQDYLEYIFRFGPQAKTEEELDSLLPWNVDLSKIEELKVLRNEAKPKPDRTESYVFNGLNGG